MGKKLLCVDIGNTSVTFGVCAKRLAIRKAFSLEHGQCTAGILKSRLKGSAPYAVVISSVVPSLTPKVSAALKRLFQAPVYVVGRDMKVPLKNKYRYPRQVGQDRLVNAFAAVRLYGAPAICVDYGTAITFDLVSRKEEYLGGLIMPGLRISLQALAEKTALLPEVELTAPRGLIGRETRESMLAGVVLGASLMTEALVSSLKHKIGAQSAVVLTGGNARLVHRYCRKIGKLDPLLTLKGLALVFASYHGSHQRL